MNHEELFPLRIVCLTIPRLFIFESFYVLVIPIHQ